ncbi:MAG: hypothetical protein ACE15F_20335 [bacterium]
MRQPRLEEAAALLRQRMNETRQRPFSELLRLTEAEETLEMRGESGRNYQIEIHAVWDDPSKTRLRVWGSIDDGGWRAWINRPPLVQDFFAYPDGRTE